MCLKVYIIVHTGGFCFVSGRFLVGSGQFLMGSGWFCWVLILVYVLFNLFKFLGYCSQCSDHDWYGTVGRSFGVD